MVLSKPYGYIQVGIKQISSFTLILLKNCYLLSSTQLYSLGVFKGSFLCICILPICNLGVTFFIHRALCAHMPSWYPRRGTNPTHFDVHLFRSHCDWRSIFSTWQFFKSMISINSRIFKAKNICYQTTSNDFFNFFG